MVEERRVGWGIERRLEFIEYRLHWEGRVNRGDVSGFFGVSAPQASNDFARYRALAPGNITYNATAKTFVAEAEFEPVLHRPSADRYLGQLRGIADGIVDRNEVPVGRGPDYDVVPQIHRKLDSELLQRVLASARGREAVLATYQSFSSPKPRERWLSPHAIAFDGMRWHMRAWCHERLGFRDFALGRVTAVSGTRKSDIDPKSDDLWHDHVVFQLAPHPGLSDGMRSAVQADYGMIDGRTDVRVRAALAYYLWKQLGLHRDVDSTPPEEQHVILLNRDEIAHVVQAPAQRSTGSGA